MLAMVNDKIVLMNYSSGNAFFIEAICMYNRFTPSYFGFFNYTKFLHIYSQGGRGNFTYLLEGQINFALKLSVGCLKSQF